MQHQHPDFKKAQTTVQFMLGPIKIKDGLFMGDQLAAKDIEFIITNKVTHIINTVSKAIPNLYERFGVQYLSVHWTQKQENIFDKKNNALNAIFTFIEEAMQQGECCLIHSLHGKSRACAVLAAYLMKKYNWSLNKTLEFINSKKQGLQVRNNYLSQMQDLQKRLLEGNKLSNSWKQTYSEQDQLLANTFNNAKKPSSTQSVLNKSNKRRIIWDEKLIQKPTNSNLSATMTRFKQQQLPVQKKQNTPHKSILKGFPNEQSQQIFGNRKEFNLDQKIINNINGNIVHVTVNNFINTEKKNDSITNKPINTRPYSSDTKDREKKNPYDIKPNKLVGFDTFTGNIKNTYQQKIMGKVGVSSSSTVNKPKKKEEIKVVYPYQRPQSAKGKTPGTLTMMMVGREQMMVTGSGGSNLGNTAGSIAIKRKLQSSIPKQQFKLK